MKLRPLAAVVTLALMVYFPPPQASAQPAAPRPARRTIEVSGNAEARATPDLAVLSLGIETRAKTAEQAASSNAALAERVIRVLRKKLGSRGKAFSGGYSLNPDYSREAGRSKPVVIGYTARNSITVRTRETRIVGALIDTAIAAGANRVNFLNFALSDATPARSEAIFLAAHRAKAQARSLAKALGVRLKRVLKASTGPQVRPIPLAESRGVAMAARAPTPIEPGQVTVPAIVSLTYEIE